jgi:hypothetical protein
MKTLTMLGISLVLALAFVAPALAEALVVVEVRTSEDRVVDGEVVLAARGDGPSYRCTTDEGACRIDDVRGGMYTATFTPAGGDAASPRMVMIPPQGRVELHLSAD